jgi:hypothetical protein
MKVTKLFALITIIAAVATNFYSCKKEKELLPDGTAKSIVAKVENAAEFSDVDKVGLIVHDRNTNKTVELASGDWERDGFVIELPETLAPSYLYPLISQDGFPVTIIIYSPSTINISNENVKMAIAKLHVIHKSGNITDIYPFKIDKHGNAKRALLTYVDSDITISGYNKGEIAICGYDEDENADVFYLWEKTTVYSIKWKKGWNVWCLSSYMSATKKTITEQWETISVDDLKWYSSKDLDKLNIVE